jgi:hypothetical protein
LRLYAVLANHDIANFLIEIAPLVCTVKALDCGRFCEAEAYLFVFPPAQLVSASQVLSIKRIYFSLLVWLALNDNNGRFEFGEVGDDAFNFLLIACIEDVNLITLCNLPGVQIRKIEMKGPQRQHGDPVDRLRKR